MIILIYLIYSSLSNSLTIPSIASTSISSPSLIILVTLSIPTTQGLLNSLLTSAPCCNIPPTSKTIPPQLIIKGVHPGSVALVINISPGLNTFSLTEFKTFAFPLIFPKETVSPINSFFLLLTFFSGVNIFPLESNNKGDLFHELNISFNSLSFFICFYIFSLVYFSIFCKILLKLFISNLKISFISFIKFFSIKIFALFIIISFIFDITKIK